MILGYRKRLNFWLFSCALAALLSHACSSHTISNDSPPEKQYEEGERLLRKERFLEAVERFRVIRSRYPYSKYAALASLRIGDTHFQEESYAEAAAAYKSFRELYPKHESAGFALHRIGESNFNMLPSNIDRDMEPAVAAIDAFEEFAKLYPEAPDADDARKKTKDLKTMLAQKEDYIGNFYFVRAHYSAAATRYKNLLDQYPDFGLNDKALYRLAYSYDKLGEFSKADEIVDRLLDLHPKSSYLPEAQKLQKSIKEHLSKEAGN